LRDLTAHANALLEDGRQIILFPEGTRTRLGARQPFQPGVAAIYQAGNAPCVPVAHNSAEHWLYPGPLKRPGEITIEFLPPIEPGVNRKIFIRRLETAIAAARPDLATPVRSAPDAADADTWSPA